MKVEIFLLSFRCVLCFCRLKKKGSATQGAGKKPGKKAGKDPNKPKRPASAFFVFMYGFLVSFSSFELSFPAFYAMVFFFLIFNDF